MAFSNLEHFRTFSHTAVRAMERYAVALDPYGAGDAEVGLPGIGLRQVGGEAKVGDRGVELGDRGEEPGCTHLRDRQLAQLVAVRLEGVAQLADAAGAKRRIGPLGRTAV